MGLFLFARQMRRHWVISTIVVLLTLVGSAGVVFMVPPTYEVESYYVMMLPPEPPTREDLEQWPELAERRRHNSFVRFADPTVVVQILSRRMTDDQMREYMENMGADEDYAVIFAGSGCTGAIDKLVGILNIRVPADLDSKYHLTDQIPEQERPVVFIGPYEHHSNELPWRESIADVIVIHEDPDGQIDASQLEAELVRYAERPRLFGSFSAASNACATSRRMSSGGCSTSNAFPKRYAERTFRAKTTIVPSTSAVSYTHLTLPTIYSV